MKNLFFLVASLMCLNPAFAKLQTFEREVSRDCAGDEPSETYDPVFEEASTENGFDYFVFGKYARDDSYYFPLVERFKDCDTTLLASDYMVLYYGFMFRDEFPSSYYICPSDKLMEEGKYEEAWTEVMRSVERFPASVMLLRKVINVGFHADRSEEDLTPYVLRMIPLMEAIAKTGDGSNNRPFTVAYVQDEYVFLDWYLYIDRIKERRSILSDGRYLDYFSIVPGADEDYHSHVVYFDASLCIATALIPDAWSKIYLSRNEAD